MLFSPLPMHIPDGFLSVVVALLCWLLAVSVIGYALRRVRADLGERQVPLLSVLAATIFAGQMLNFSVTGGTSGHLLGAALATILLGPWAAMLVMTCVVSVQALVFQDGGLLTLGANLCNMAIIGVAVAYFVYHTLYRLTGTRTWGRWLSGFAAGWSSIFIASLSCALQLALSGTTPANLAIPAMGGIHALIGIGEGLITVGALAFIYATRRDLLVAQGPATASYRPVWLGGLGLAILLAIAAPLASTHPDGLEWVAEQQGFLGLMQEPLYRLLPDYGVPGVSNPKLAAILAGLVGIGLVMGAAVGVAQLRRQRTLSQEPPSA